jgi:acyl-CoA synthetase (AMP-forming)/AMP-acid ligase II
MSDGSRSVSLNVHLWCICLVQFVVVFIAVTRVQAIAAPLNAAYTEDEFKFYLEDAGSTLLLVPGAEGNKAAEAAAAELNLPIAGVHWEKETGDVVIVPKSKIELAPELEVSSMSSCDCCQMFFCMILLLPIRMLRPV